MRQWKANFATPSKFYFSRTRRHADKSTSDTTRTESLPEASLWQIRDPILSTSTRMRSRVIDTRPLHVRHTPRAHHLRCPLRAIPLPTRREQSWKNKKKRKTKKRSIFVCSPTQNHQPKCSLCPPHRPFDSNPINASPVLWVLDPEQGLGELPDESREGSSSGC